MYWIRGVLAKSTGQVAIFVRGLLRVGFGNEWSLQEPADMNRARRACDCWICFPDDSRLDLYTPVRLDCACTRPPRV
jgi:hypothetical protein